MNLLENVSLKAHNTFGIEAKAKAFVEISHVSQLQELYHDPAYSFDKKLIIGGGSNILLTGDFEGIVAKILLKGIEIVKENSQHVWLKAAAGETWHDLVMFTVANGWGGIENLSLIPGSVGAAPMQNIGAYGVELKDSFYELEALNIISNEIHVFDNNDCQFGYRESIFKHEAKGNYVILSVTLKLSKKPKLHIAYGAIKDTLAEMKPEKVDIRAVSDAVISIRQSKLPNPKEIGNAGSFFKNPEVPLEQFENIKSKYAEVPSYPIDDHHVKIPAGWLIEKAGWKGYREGDIGVHAKQALVLVNYGNAKGKQIKNLAEIIQKDIHEKFGIKLQMEVNII